MSFIIFLDGFISSIKILYWYLSLYVSILSLKATSISLLLSIVSSISSLLNHTQFFISTPFFIKSIIKWFFSLPIALKFVYLQFLIANIGEAFPKPYGSNKDNLSIKSKDIFIIESSQSIFIGFFVSSLFKFSTAYSFILFENSSIFSIAIEKPAAPACPPYLIKISLIEFKASIILKASVLLHEAVAIPSKGFISIIIVGL